MDDGWLIGFNGGEFGATLWWFSEDGQKNYKISDDQIVQIINLPDGLYGLEGLAHLNISKGKVIKLYNEDPAARWASRLYVQLPQAPEVGIAAGDGSLIIVTTSSLIRLTQQKNVETLIENAFWDGLYPNSVIIDKSRDIYIGMRQGVAKWHLGDRSDSIKWLIPNEKILEEDLKTLNRSGC